jgi:hypothetical protein
MPRTNVQSERWEIHGAYVSAVKWGDLDMSDDSLSTVSVTITYDYALIKDANEKKILPYNTGEGFGSLKTVPDSVKSLTATPPSIRVFAR